MCHLQLNRNAITLYHYEIIHIQMYKSLVMRVRNITFMSKMHFKKSLKNMSKGRWKFRVKNLFRERQLLVITVLVFVVVVSKPYININIFIYLYLYVFIPLYGQRSYLYYHIVVSFFQWVWQTSKLRFELWKKRIITHTLLSCSLAIKIK